MFDDLRDKIDDFTDKVKNSNEEETDESEEDVEAVVEQEETAGVSDKVKARASGQKIITDDDINEPLEELEMYLVEHDVDVTVAEEVTSNVREELVGTKLDQFDSVGAAAREAVEEALLEVLAPSNFDFDEFIQDAEKPVTLVFVGINGVGKTTTISKLANRLEKQGYSTVVANGDTFRAGANKQMEEHVENLDLDYISHERGGDPAAVIYDAIEYAEANDIDVVLGDTAGRLHTSNDLMEQLKKINRVTDPDFTVFVEESIAGQDAIRRAEEFNETIGIDGTILTKADMDAEGGAAVSLAYVTGEPVIFIGNGQTYDSLVQFSPELFIDYLFGKKSKKKQ